jgi:PAS domain-containing protein
MRISEYKYRHLFESLGDAAFLALFHDITERKRSEQKIQEQANLLELAHDAIFVRSLDEKIQMRPIRQGRANIEPRSQNHKNRSLWQTRSSTLN